MQRRVDEVPLGLGGPVIDLHGEHTLRRDLEERSSIGAGPRTMPRVDIEPPVGPVGERHDLERGRQIGDPRPRQPFEVDQQSVVRRTVAQPGERGGGLLDAPVAADDVGARSVNAADVIGDPEQLRLSESEHVHRVELRWDRERRRARGPPPRRIEFGDDEPVIIEERDQILVGITLVARRRIVPTPQRNGREAGRRGGGQPFLECGVTRKRSRAQHKVVR